MKKINKYFLNLNWLGAQLLFESKGDSNVFDSFNSNRSQEKGEIERNIKTLLLEE